MFVLIALVSIFSVATTQTTATSPHQGGGHNNNLTFLTSEVKDLKKLVESLQNQLQRQTRTQVAVSANVLAKLDASEKELTTLKDKHERFSSLCSSRVLQLEQTVSELQTQSKTLSQSHAQVQVDLMSYMTEAQGDIVALKTNYSSLEVNVETLLGNATSIGQDVKFMKPSLKQLEQRVSGLETDVGIQVQRHTDDIGRVENNITQNSQDIVSLNSHFTVLGSSMNSISTDLHRVSSSLDHYHNKTKRFENYITSELSQIQTSQGNTNTELAIFNTTLSTLQKDFTFHMNTYVTFKVTHSEKQMLGRKAGEFFKFDHVEYNTGNGYDNKTGIFTVPVSGSYLFWFACNFHGPRKGEIHIMTDNTTVIGAGSGFAMTGYSSTARVVTVATLQTGQKVHFTVAPDPNNRHHHSDITINTGADMGTEYGGFLLRPQ